ncbi:MAG: hypothetical protein ACXQTE_05955 [Methanosarcinaceae archaeon]
MDDAECDRMQHHMDIRFDDLRMFLEDKFNAADRRHEEHERDIHHLDKRVSNLERWKAWIGGALVIVGVVVKTIYDAMT